MSDARIIREINDLTLEAFPTGRKDCRGQITLRLDSESYLSPENWLSPDQARELARVLIELAGKAEKFSTRGFVGSDE